MLNITKALYKINILDELASKDTPIHSLHPTVKLAVTLVYITIVVSFGKYEIIGLLPLIFYPIILITMADIPLKLMLSGIAAAAPFVIGVGIFNPLLNRQLLATVLGIGISTGAVSLLSLLLKCTMTVLAALILITTTGMNRIAAALQRLHIPRIFIVQLLLTYRYISILAGEAARAYNAYMLRAPEHKGIDRRLWGPFLGQLLLRTLDRAQRVYQSMKLRGFHNEFYGVPPEKLSVKDFIYLTGWVGFFIVVRMYNLPMVLGQIVTGVIK